MDENENFPTGELPIAAGDAAVSDNSGGTVNAAASPVLYRVDPQMPASLVIIPSRIDMEKEESQTVEASAEAEVIIAQGAGTELTEDISISATSAFQLINEDGRSLWTQVYVAGKLYDGNSPLAVLNTSGTKKQSFELRALKDKEDPNTRGTYTGIMTFTISYGE